MMKRIAKWSLIGMASIVLAIGAFSVVSEFMKKQAEKAQRRTMQNINAWAHAWETYYMKAKTYLPPNRSELEFSWGNITSRQLMDMFHKKDIKETMLQKLNPLDGWGNDLQFVVSGNIKNSNYWIRAPGRDGVWDMDSYTSKACYYYDCDIVLANAMFIQWPAGSAIYPRPFEDNIWGWPLRKAKPPAGK